MHILAVHARLGVWLAAATLACISGGCAPDRGPQGPAKQAASAADAPDSAGGQTATGPHANPRDGQPARTAPPTPTPSSTTSSTGLRRDFKQGEPTCGAAALRAELTPDEPTYAAGEDVRLLGTITNTSGQTCAISTADEIVVTDAAGSPFYEGTFDTGNVEDIEPGQTRSTTFTWRQQSCREAGCPEKATPGQYTVSFRWSAVGQAIKASAVFRIT